MELHVNGHWVGSYILEQGVSKLSYRISREYVLPGTDYIEITFGKLADLNGFDERTLAMSFFMLEIGRVIPAQKLEGF